MRVEVSENIGRTVMKMSDLKFLDVPCGAGTPDNHSRRHYRLNASQSLPFI